MDDFIKVPGFIVYREYDFFNELVKEPDTTREVLFELEDEGAAKLCVAEESVKHPNDKVYYEACTITI